MILLYDLADLNSTSEDTKQLMSAVRIDTGDHDNHKKVIDINQMLKMMEYNPVNVTFVGLVIDYNLVNGTFIAIVSLIGTGLLQYFFPQIANA